MVIFWRKKIGGKGVDDSINKYSLSTKSIPFVTICKKRKDYVLLSKKIGRTTVRPNISIDTSRCMISEDQCEKGIHHLFGEAINATKRQLCIYR